MHRFYAPPDAIDGMTARLGRDEAAHAQRVLRLSSGAAVEVLDGTGRVFAGVIASFGQQGGEVRLERELPSREPDCRVTLYPGFCKGDRMDLIVQKAVELGVWAIRPALTARCVVRMDERDAQGKAERLQRVALEAAKQTGRGLVPTVYPPLPLARIIPQAQHQRMLVPWEEAEGLTLLRAIGDRPMDVGVLIGPEGGLEAAEVAAVTRAGGLCVTLGPRILRAETACIAAVALLTQTLL